MGSVAAIKSKANLLSSLRLVLFFKKDLTIDMISFLKKNITAHKVPAWTTISNAKPRSFEPNIKDGNKR